MMVIQSMMVIHCFRPFTFLIRFPASILYGRTGDAISDVGMKTEGASCRFLLSLRILRALWTTLSLCL
jgi:hypothetical protein